MYIIVYQYGTCIYQHVRNELKYKVDSHFLFLITHVTVQIIIPIEVTSMHMIAAPDTAKLTSSEIAARFFTFSEKNAKSTMKHHEDCLKIFII